MSDRLLRLSMARAALRWAGLRSLENLWAADSETMARLGEHGSFVDRLAREGHPDVLAALFEPPDWHVAGLLTDSGDCLLVIEGCEPLTYHVDDPEGERRAWAAITAAMVRGQHADTTP